MGRKSKSGLRTGGGSLPAVSEADLRPSAISRDLKIWMGEHNAIDFTTNAPDSITVGGVKYNLIGEDTSYTTGGVTRYENVYQSSVQDTRGEWPLIAVVVDKEYTPARRGALSGTTSYKFNTNTFGTGLR